MSFDKENSKAYKSLELSKYLEAQKSSEVIDINFNLDLNKKQHSEPNLSNLLIDNQPNSNKNPVQKQRINWSDIQQPENLSLSKLLQ